MSSPNTTPRRTPKRTTPKRTPLQERSPSERNEDAGRLHKESRQDLTDDQIFTSNPFPTKPQQILLPSTVRNRSRSRHRHHAGPELSALFGSSQPELPSSSSAASRRQDERRMRRAPNLNLKKSVTALRDMYEAQAENSRPSTAHPSRPGTAHQHYSRPSTAQQYSRPSTAAPSPALRPTTSNSRIRSISSVGSEGFPNRSAWEMLGVPQVSADDLSLLPTLSEIGSRLDLDQSFASRMRNIPETSSPNFRTYGSSSPALPTYHDVATTSDPAEESSSSGAEMTGLSSGFIQLHHNSSQLTTDPTPPLHEEDEEEEGESSPNLVKLGTSSPKRSSSPAASISSVSSKKRKRSEMESSTNAGRTPLFFGARRSRSHSSPPIRNVPESSDLSVQSSEPRILPSSPPEADSVKSQDVTSSPNIQVYAGSSPNRSSIVSAHANLQTVLSSSPGPPPVRPIVRAPNVHQFENLALQKRATSGQTVDTARLSPVPSVTNIEVRQLSSTDLTQYHQRRNSSRMSVFTEDLDDADSITPAQPYILDHDLNGSQVNMISDHDRHEASDELRALPREHGSFAAALSQVRSASFLGSTSSSNSNSLSRFESMRNSMDSRLQSMRSYAHGRDDSFRSSQRPGSSGSYISQNFPVPTWAQQYYSGLYRHSFQYLYQSTPNLPYTVNHIRPPSQSSSRPISVPLSSYAASSSKSASKLRRSLSRSVSSSIKKIMPSISKPRMNVRQSHMTVGVGPLVSNPVRPQTDLLSRPPTAYQNPHTIRRVSAPVSAADPRYHWNGIIEEPETREEAESMQDHGYTGTPRYAESVATPTAIHTRIARYPAPWRFLRQSTPHLHHDRRLHTGSSASRGFGAPYNSRHHYQPPNGMIDEVKADRPFWSPDLRDTQVICFIIGFICPLAWFIGAFLPLPTRPSRFSDIEKSGFHSRNFTDSNDWDEGDIVARLRLEKHMRGLEEVKWQNARWWKRMNRWMSIVGFVVVVIVIVLAVIGTRGQLS